MKQRFVTLLKSCFTLLSILFLQQQAQAQIYYNDFVRSDRQWEFDFNTGPSTFLGDVGGGKGKGTMFLKDVNTQTVSIFGGVGVTYFPNQWLGIKLNFDQGKVSGFDSLIRNQRSDEVSRKKRNLSFRSNISELNLSFEFYPTAYLVRKESFFNNKLRPYLSIGIGAFHFNPQGVYDAPDGSKRWVDLKPLRLEGEGMAEYDVKEYKNIALQMPLGFGLKYFINDRWYIGAEVLQRFTFTDYVDDVSQKYIDPALFSKYLPKDQVAIAEQMMFKRALVANNRPVSEFIGKERGDATDKDYYISAFLKVGFKFGERDTDVSCAGKRYYSKNYF